jgi:hypothetical protein
MTFSLKRGHSANTVADTLLTYFFASARKQLNVSVTVVNTAKLNRNNSSTHLRNNDILLALSTDTAIA